MQAPQAPLIHEFGDFALDTQRRVLTNRTEDQPVDITGRVLDALIYFVERPGQLIEKRALIDALWPNVVVEDGNLTQTIHSLRRVLGEQAGEHRYIATVPGRGYQFVAAVSSRTAGRTTPAAPAPAGSPPASAAGAPPVPNEGRFRRRAWIPAAGAIALLLLVAAAVFWWQGRNSPGEGASVSAHASIAVLPFVDMSEEQNQAHFADGLSEEILNLLARAQNLRVIARTSSFSFKGENVDIRTIAQRLDVAYVLEGSVRKAGDQLRITAQLIDARTSAHIWSDTYDRDVHDVFGVQREIASSVAGALRVTLAREGPRRAETTSAEAYEHFLQGRFLFNRRAAGDLRQAKTHFDEAVRIDPTYGRAWAGLAGVYYAARYEGVEFPDPLNNWSHAVQRAITVDPELAEGHMRAAQYYWQIGERPMADAELARAEALDPQDSLVLGAYMSEFIEEGRISEAIEIQERLVAIDPLSASNRGNLAAFLTTVGRLSEAQVELERALELSPASPALMTTVADVLILQDRTSDALEVLSRMPDGYLRKQRLAIVHFKLGQDREGAEVLEQLEDLAKKPDPDGRLPLAIAEVYAAERDGDRAFTWLRRTFSPPAGQSKPKPCWKLLEEMQISAYLRPLRADPRWSELLETARTCLY